MTFRLALYAIAAAGLLWLGWVINGWRIDASQLPAARAALAEEQMRNIQESVDRLRVGFQVDRAHETLNTTYFLQLKKVPIYVPDNRGCDLGPDVVSLLNAANRLPGTTEPASKDGGGTDRRSGAIIAAGGD